MMDLVSNFCAFFGEPNEFYSYINEKYMSSSRRTFVIFTNFIINYNLKRVLICIYNFKKKIIPTDFRYF